MRPLVGLALMLFALALVNAGCTRMKLFRRADQLASAPRVGASVPEIDGIDFEGKRFKLSEYRGKVVVVTFWASWCPPCRRMIPHERELVERYRDKPFALLSVNNDEDQDAARKVIASQQINWPNWKTTGAKDPINARWHVESWPSIFVIDASGILRYTRVTGPYLENAIETLLAELNTTTK